jgi:hypothetical protein
LLSSDKFFKVLFRKTLTIEGSSGERMGYSSSDTPEIVVTQPIFASLGGISCVGAVGPNRSMGAHLGSRRDIRSSITFLAPMFPLMRMAKTLYWSMVFFRPWRNRARALGLEIPINMPQR